MAVCNIKKNNLSLFSNMSLKTNNSKVDFLAKIILASFISSIGLITNSQEGVIGSMLISPLGGPIMGLVSALLVFDIGASVNSIIFILLGFIVMLSAGAIIGHFSKNDKPTEEMKKRYGKSTKWTLINGILVGIVFSVVALSSGSAISEGVGAGIAISLLPPVTNCGVTLMNSTINKEDKKEYMKNTMFITILNILGIIVASLIVFTIYCKFKYVFKWE